MANIYLIRHGDYTELENGKYLENPGLSEVGIKQGELLRDHLLKTEIVKADILLSSSLKRAQETAEILAPALGVPVILDRELEEWRSDDGSIDPDEFDKIWQAIPSAKRPFARLVDGCETWLEFSARVQQALNRIIEEYEGKNIVIICHGGVIQVSFIYFFAISGTNPPGISIGNTSVTHWSQAEIGQRWTLKRYNDMYHL